MYLTLSKRFEFSASHRLYKPGLSDEKNFEIYGRESGGRFGHGHNFVLYVVISGRVDEKTGMIINVTDIKKEVNKIISAGYDHKYLNDDHPAFENKIPTPENMATELLKEITALFKNSSVNPVACHLVDSSESEVTAYAGGSIERKFVARFSSARRTRSPLLSDDENFEKFGSAAGIHGHNYKVVCSVKGQPDQDTGLICPMLEIEAALKSLHDELDHKYLNDLDDLHNKPITTESLSKFIFDRLRFVSRVELWENENFGVEYSAQAGYKMIIRSAFHAAHRLHSPHLSVDENIAIYGNCDNPHGHGHEYKVELTISGEYDARSGTICDLVELNDKLSGVLDQYDYKHLDLETDDFKNQPSTGENILRMIYDKCRASIGDDVTRLRLWETPNNRFTIRKEKDQA